MSSIVNRKLKKQLPSTAPSAVPEEPRLVRRRVRILPLLVVIVICLLSVVLMVYGPGGDSSSTSGFRMRDLQTAFTDGGIRGGGGHQQRRGGDGDGDGDGGGPDGTGVDGGGGIHQDDSPLSASVVMAGIKRRQAQSERRMRDSMKTPVERAYEAAYITQRHRCVGVESSDRSGTVFEWDSSTSSGVCKPLPGSKGDVVAVKRTLSDSVAPPTAATKVQTFAVFAAPPSSLSELRSRHTDAIADAIEELSASSGSTEWATTIVNAYVSYVFETSWLMPKWADYTPRMLAGLREAIRSSSSASSTGGDERAATLKGRHTGETGLYQLENFCVTSDGKLMGPPQPLPRGDGPKVRSPLGPFIGRDEHPLLTRMADVNPFLEAAVPINHHMADLFKSKSPATASSSHIPPFLPMTVMIYPTTGFSSLSNAGHNMHRLASLNAIREDMSVDLLLTLTSIAPPASGAAPEKVAKSLFRNACDSSHSSSSSTLLRGVRDGGGGGPCHSSGDETKRWVSGGLSTMGFGPHYQLLGLPITSLNIPTKCGDDVSCTDNHRRLFLSAAMLGRGIHNTQSGHGDGTSSSPPSTSSSSSSTPFMCFKRGVIYQNHLGPDFHVKEFDALTAGDSSSSARAVFRGAKVAKPIAPVQGGSGSSGGGGVRHEPNTFREITIVGADTDSIFLDSSSGNASNSNAVDKMVPSDGGEDNDKKGGSSGGGSPPRGLVISAGEQPVEDDAMATRGGAVGGLGDENANTNSNNDTTSSSSSASNAAATTTEEVAAFPDADSNTPNVTIRSGGGAGGAPTTTALFPLSNEDNFNKKRWHYAMGMKTWASVRKRELLMGLRDRAAYFEERILPPIVNISVMINGEVTQRPLSRKSSTSPSSSSSTLLRVLFVARTSSRYIPGFSSFAAHISRGFPRMEFQFVEDMSPPKSSTTTNTNTNVSEAVAGGMDWFLGRSARHADIMIGVHGGGLTNSVYLPKAPSSSITSVGGSVLVEIGNPFYIRSAKVQIGMYGTFTASLGIPHAQLSYTPTPFRAGPANISLSALQDSIALGVCMWCSHNIENPHARAPDMDPSGKHQIEAYFNQRCPSKTRSLAASASPFDEPPLPQRLWDRCCRCVFSRWGDVNQLRRTRESFQGDGSDPGAWLLRYDIPMAPLLRDGVSSHVTDREVSDFFKRGLKGAMVRSGVCIGCSYDGTECLAGALRLAVLKFTAHADAPFTREWVSRTLMKDIKMAAKVYEQQSNQSSNSMVRPPPAASAITIDGVEAAADDEGGGAAGAPRMDAVGIPTKISNSKFNFNVVLDPLPFRARVSSIAANESKRTFDDSDYTSHCGPVMFLLSTINTIHKARVINYMGTSSSSSGVLEMLLRRFVDDSSCLWNPPSHHQSGGTAADSSSSSSVRGGRVPANDHFVDVDGVGGDAANQEHTSATSDTHAASSGPSATTMTSYTALEGALKMFVANYCEKVNTLAVGRKQFPGGRFQIAAVASPPQPIHIHRHRSIRVKRRM